MHLGRVARWFPVLVLFAVAWAGKADFCRAEEGEWPQFLGPDRNGVSKETNLLDGFPATGPKEVFRVTAGVGMSGLAVSHGWLVTLVQRDGKQIVLALDAATGKRKWETKVSDEFENPQGPGPRSTPCISGDDLFVFTGDGKLAALTLATGKIRWTKEPLVEFRGELPDYGLACSPLVVGENVIIVSGAPGGCVAAFNCQTGAVTWKSGDDTAGYSSPALLKLAGKEQVVAFTGRAAVGLAPSTGVELWRYPFTTDFDCNIATPIAIGPDRVFVSAGENHGSVLLSLAADGEKFAVKEAWKSLGPSSVMRNEWQTSVLVDGYLYGMDNVGGAGPVTNLNCVEAKTGKRVWQKPRFGKGNLIAADGKLWISTIAGELVLVRAKPKKFEELGRARILEPTRQAPALVGGRMFLRDDAEIVCVDVSN